MNRPQKIALYYLLGMVLFSYGIAVGRYDVFPAQYLGDVEAFMAFEADTGKLSLSEKLESEVGGKPSKFLFRYHPDTIVGARELPLNSIKPRREFPRIKVEEGHDFGYRAIFGALDFEDSFWGGVLLGPGSEVVHRWKLSTKEQLAGDRIDQTQIVYGLALFPDGSVIYITQDTAQFGSLMRIDACGEIMWRSPNAYHHTVSVNEDGKSFWSLQGDAFALHHTLARVDVATGNVLQRINMKDVYEKNDDIHIFLLHKSMFPSAKDLQNLVHGNDIDELGVAQAGNFPLFEAGDLLLSYRNYNLLFVIDPDTLELKWWRVGAADRQHDSDWEDGVITVFSNNAAGARTGASDIVRIDPNTMKHDILIDGKTHGIYSMIMARQQLSSLGTRMVVATTGGHVAEFDENGKEVWSFLNVYDSEKGQVTPISEAYRVERSFFNEDFWSRDCSAR